MSIMLAILVLGLQDAPQSKLAYPDVSLENDPLAPLPEPEMASEPAPPPEVVRAAQCPTRKFEGEIEFVGPPSRRSPIILCADSNDPADYEKMLRSAKRQIAFNADFTVGSRSDFMAAIDAELATLAEGEGTSVEAPVAVGR
ncbi:hypothetical protein [Sphingomicrobium clamense]|uniref:Uncharacterized protein n=1 Tax=Sphingomicrobium clamense TaxID=2851013 RepID=A0ABS6V4W3_9SPHN|nr:hypothetical protein [Sphingomicrobium sp. B8]MBW0144588.1 hypothetical protein [Sphingomicrobium sp. B8]